MGTYCYLETRLSRGLSRIILFAENDLPARFTKDQLRRCVSNEQLQNSLKSFELGQTQSERFNVGDCKIEPFTKKGNRRSGYVTLNQKTEMNSWEKEEAFNSFWDHAQKCLKNLPSSFKESSAIRAFPECFETFSLECNETGKLPLLVSGEYKSDSSFLIAYTLPSTTLLARDNMGAMETATIIRDICALQKKQMAKGNPYLYGKLGIGANKFNQIMIKGNFNGNSGVPDEEAYKRLKSVVHESITRRRTSVLSDSTSAEISCIAGDYAFAAKCCFISKSFVKYRER
jgi:hypothetical protein